MAAIFVGVNGHLNATWGRGQHPDRVVTACNFFACPFPVSGDNIARAHTAVASGMPALHDAGASCSRRWAEFVKARGLSAAPADWQRHEKLEWRKANGRQIGACSWTLCRDNYSYEKKKRASRAVLGVLSVCQCGCMRCVVRPNLNDKQRLKPFRET